MVSSKTPDGVRTTPALPSIGRSNSTRSSIKSLTQTQSDLQSMESMGVDESGLASTVTSVSATSGDSIKALRSVHSRPPTPARTRSRAASLSSRSSSRQSRPRSILVSTTEPVVQVTPPIPSAEVQEPLTDSGSSSSPSSSENDLQSPATDAGDSSRSTLTSSCSSSCIGSGFESVASGASSIRTRATSTSSPCVTFAPLPEIGPRQRKSSRPLGLAARGQILRQRRMIMTQDDLSYYDESINSIPGSERMERRIKDRSDRPRIQRDELDEAEVAFAALGKMIGDATKVIWQRVAHSKSKNGESSLSDQKRPKPSEGFTWPRRLSKSKSQKSDLDHESENETDSEIDGPWSKRQDEDPMTKTVVEGSDDGLDHFVLAYDSPPVSEEEEEEHANARADEELRTTVEVRLVKASEWELEV